MLMRIPALLLYIAMAIAPVAACASQDADQLGPAASTTPDDGRLIGYQLKRLDQLIESTFDRLLAKAGLSRREWQTLNVVRTAPIDDAALVDALRPFWEVNRENAATVVSDLRNRGWIVQHADQRYALTPAGSDVYNEASSSVDRIRNLASTGIGADEFDTTMDVMGRMIANLENQG
ncbi:MarR family winged helix-turn-helix transcriptional regulator [Nocardia sp. CNY236]|uniref:MarR family winged helix-turn-helix transcriptional regulator n=1 Tax=Nocardia sp. CNY236 TaxID=1169152 RepID=UPI0003FF420E|nr:winged helix DNA-binding protein [Nocardia sp. CNY236]